eukprot:CAMPEP_0197458374 /NCGR_PEP_ID=MMETSP1175-20131217/48467_1 /TAXON_ID=1003142 /ORGANISM="Triceratium dubium, Strain CCMP147" /LENGTH=162 /DNA_ID=CAMNT_0042992997 /DNA_START=18 /DNA_END=506 /DNA_ORIENTATION=+
MITRMYFRSAARCLSIRTGRAQSCYRPEQAHKGSGTKQGKFYIHSSPRLALGILDDAKDFLSGLTMRAEASHILIKGTDSGAKRKIDDIKKEIGNDSDKFAELAALTSDCPSGQQGGSLGEFGRYSMVPEFDKVVFNEEVGVVHGPIETSFGYHLILIHRRN